MLFKEPLLFITTYIEKLNAAIETHSPGQELSRKQRYWLSFTGVRLGRLKSILPHIPE